MTRADAASTSRASLALRVLLVAVATVAVLEVVVRLAGLAPELPTWSNYVADPLIPFKLRPGSVHRAATDAGSEEIEYAHNGLGFRDVDHAPSKQPGVFRIVALGDSFTYGVGARFADTYLVQLEQRLNHRRERERPVEIIKLGVPRFFPAAERLVLEHYGLRYRPDLVLVGVTPSDVLDTYMGLDYVRVRDGFLVTRAADELGPLARRAYQASHVMRIILAAATGVRNGPRGAGRRDQIDVADGFHEPEWKAMEADLDAMAMEARANGARFGVIAVPQKPPWEPGRDYFEQRLGAWAQSRGALFVAVLPRMRAQAEPAKLFWPDDGHCNAAGYRIIADAIFDHLVEQGAM